MLEDYVIYHRFSRKRVICAKGPFTVLDLIHQCIETYFGGRGLKLVLYPYVYPNCFTNGIREAEMKILLLEILGKEDQCFS